jgi:hypothetical protein
MKYNRNQFNNEYYSLWEMGLLIAYPENASVYSVKFRINENDVFSRVTVKATSVSNALERACYLITATSPWRPEEVDLHAVYDIDENLLWLDEPFYHLVQKKYEFRGMDRREFLAKFGATSAAILFGLKPFKHAEAGQLNLNLAGTSSGFSCVNTPGGTHITGNPGSSIYTTPGTYIWCVPSGVTSVCVVAIGAGATNAGGGGGLTWSNGLTVAAGASYTVIVGQGGLVGSSQASSFNNNSCKADGGGSGGGGGGSGGDSSRAVGASTYGGGNGGHWGGGAGGYSGNGGAGYGLWNTTNAGAAGAGGGGGGGGNQAYPNNGGGGGTGIYGLGANGTYPGGGGSGGGTSSSGGSISVSGIYGGGGVYAGSAAGANGAVRIIWGTGRSFPSSAA